MNLGRIYFVSGLRQGSRSFRRL